MADVLARICALKREHVAACRRERPLAELERLLPGDRPRGFRQALEAAVTQGRLALIAEIKKASPSRGLIRAEFDPPALARAYAQGGASCLSVLTDRPFFQGQDGDLVAARAAVPLPVLRKDFMLEPYQVVEARVLGADCILIIMACLGDAQAEELLATATALGMDALIEVHDRAELERALRLKGHLIGINNRNLKTLAVDLATTEALAPLVPEGWLVVAESGLGRHEDLVRLTPAGARAFLVGERLMGEPDVALATRRLLGLDQAA